MSDYYPDPRYSAQPAHGRAPAARHTPTVLAAAVAGVIGLTLGAGGMALLGGSGTTAAPTPTPTVTENVVNVVVPQSCADAVVLGKRAIESVLDAAADESARDAALDDVDAFAQQGEACQKAAE